MFASNALNADCITTREIDYYYYCLLDFFLSRRLGVGGASVVVYCES